MHDGQWLGWDGYSLSSNLYKISQDLASDKEYGTVDRGLAQESHKNEMQDVHSEQVAGFFVLVFEILYL